MIYQGGSNGDFLTRCVIRQFASGDLGGLVGGIAQGESYVVLRHIFSVSFAGMCIHYCISSCTGVRAMATRTQRIIVCGKMLFRSSINAYK
jgi:hypothetical protein